MNFNHIEAKWSHLGTKHRQSRQSFSCPIFQKFYEIYKIYVTGLPVGAGGCLHLPEAERYKFSNIRRTFISVNLSVCPFALVNYYVKLFPVRREEENGSDCNFCKEPNCSVCAPKKIQNICNINIVLINHQFPFARMMNGRVFVRIAHFVNASIF